ncbi:MAG: hypothetical protein R3F59_33270 [Myxococcota bacterium]
MGMDASNLRILRSRCPAALRSRLHLALEPVGGGDVDDPYYGGEAGFEANFAELRRALDAWIDRMLDA